MSLMNLIKLAMTTPAGGKNITYSPSKITPNKTISQTEFAERYADYGQARRVDMNRDGNVEIVTTYSVGMDGWWMIDDGFGPKQNNLKALRLII